MNCSLNVSHVSKLKQFIEEYPNEELHQHFKILQEICPLHRIIKGDGNCFYRVFAFLYLCNTNCELQASYIKQQARDEIQEIWSYHIIALQQLKTKQQKQSRLEQLFNNVERFDEILIKYFRSINYGYISKNKEKFISFFESQEKFEKELQRIMQFGQESEGIQIYALAEALQTRITIFCIDAGGFEPVYYMENLEDKGIYLFFRPGHYDIVYPANAEKILTLQQAKKTSKSRKLRKKQPVKKWLLGQFSEGPMNSLWYQLLIFGTVLTGFVLYSPTI